MVNNDLTAKEIVTLLAHDDPKVTDPEGAVMVEFEMTFLEFFEALIGEFLGLLLDLFDDVATRLRGYDEEMAGMMIYKFECSPPHVSFAER